MPSISEDNAAGKDVGYDGIHAPAAQENVFSTLVRQTETKRTEIFCITIDKLAYARKSPSPQHLCTALVFKLTNNWYIIFLTATRPRNRDAILVFGVIAKLPLSEYLPVAVSHAERMIMKVLKVHSNTRVPRGCFRHMNSIYDK